MNTDASRSEPVAPIRSLPFYTLTALIHEGSDTLLYRGHRNADHAPITVKMLRSEYPSPRLTARLRHEYSISQELDLEGVVKVLALEDHGRTVALVMEDFDGESLHAIIQRNHLDVERALCIAISLAKTVGLIHERSIIHKDIKPHNILVHSSTGEIKLTDFGIATRLTQEIQGPESPHLLEGTLAYMSPEQTGRINRTVDFRTDFYSVGVTLYEMFSGVLPFQATDPLELVHSHIARTAAPLHTRSRQVPEMVSAIVMKLLAKTAEDRYQSGFGVAADLEECLRQWRAAGRIAQFQLGRHDATDALRIPEKLYGREADVAALFAAFERVMGGATEVLLISGHAGIGKSSLVSEVHKAIAAHGGLFATGKFEQLSRRAPYSALAGAFREPVRHLLAERGDVLDGWRNDLQRAVGVNGQLLVELVPELELVLGPQPMVPKLGSTESQNRFNLVFQNFVRVFATAERPLIIFLDDLQWADVASLKLIRALLADPERPRFLLIGAYRDHEVDAGHPLSLALADLRHDHTKIEEIELKPLALSDVRQLVSDTLGCEPSRAGELSDRLHEKTQGNPFYLKQLLKKLHVEGALSFDIQAKRWRWSTKAIEELPAAQNVVDLMIGKFERLRPETQRLLTFAACIGHEFDLRTLSRINDQPERITAGDLWEALKEGLVVPLSPEYRFLHDVQDALHEGNGAPPLPAFEVRCRFLHDRVQQAAYSRMEDVLRREVHLKLGRLLLATAGAAPSAEDLFPIVNHKNLGAPLLTDPGERLELARLNLAAGKRAKLATAYESAISFLDAGILLLDGSSWESAYELSHALHIELAECEMLEVHVAKTESLLDTLLTHARSRIDRTRAYELRGVLYTRCCRYADALRAGREGLASFGIDLPDQEHEMEAAIGRGLAEIQAILAGRPIHELAHAPMMTDPDQRAAMGLLSAVQSAAYMVTPLLTGLVNIALTTICLNYGRSELSPFVYASYAFFLTMATDRYEEARELWHLAAGMNETHGTADLRSRTNLVLAACSHFFVPLKTTLFHCEQAIDSGVESGEFTHASYAANVAAIVRLSACGPLGEVRQEIDKSLALMQRTKDAMSVMVQTVARQFVASLMGRTSRLGAMDDETFDETKFTAQVEASGIAYADCWYSLARLELAVIAGDDAAAMRMADRVEQKVSGSVGQYIATEIPFYLSLTFSAAYLEAPPADQERYRAKLAGYLDTMTAHARRCPENYHHKWLLMAAEMSRISGGADAWELYSQAINEAQRAGFLLVEAIASERCALFYMARRAEKLGNVYLLDAHRCYMRLGADSKALDLVKKHPHLLASDEHARDLATTTTTTTVSGKLGAELDALTVIRAAQAISSEIALDKLIERLMDSVIQNAGATRGTLLLQRGEQLVVQAKMAIHPNRLEADLSLPLAEERDIPASVVQVVARTHAPVVLGNAAQDDRFGTDPYIAAEQPRSILCLAMIHRGRLTGILYLENHLTRDAFTQARVDLSGLLASQAAIAVENALLLADVKRRTDALHEANEQLQRELAERAVLQEELMRVQTPIIPITDTIMVMPLIGNIDKRRAEQVLQTALYGVQSHQAEVVIVDITGVPNVDAYVASSLVKTARALGMLGAHAVVTGIRPAMAQAIIQLGLDLGSIVTRGTLQGGIAYAVGRSTSTNGALRRVAEPVSDPGRQGRHREPDRSERTRKPW